MPLPPHAPRPALHQQAGRGTPHMAAAPRTHPAPHPAPHTGDGARPAPGEA